MSRASRMVARSDETTQRQVRCDNALPLVLAAIQAGDAAFHIKAQSYDSPRVGGHTTRRDEEGVSMPALSDPVGEHAAVVATDVEVELKEIEAALTSCDKATAHLERLLARHNGAVARMTKSRAQLRRDASEAAQTEAQVARENDCCASCKRLYLREPQGTDPGQRWINLDLFVTHSTVKGVLDRAVPLCEWCWRFIEAKGRMPTTNELADRAAGRRVRR